MDAQNNPVAHNFDTMIEASARAHRKEIIDKMQAVSTAAPIPAPAAPAPVQPVPQNNYWFLNQPSQQTATVVPQDTVTFNTQVVAPGAPASALPVTAAMPTADEESFIKEHKNDPLFSPNMHGHLHVIQPLSDQQAAGAPQPAPGINSTAAAAQNNVAQAAPQGTGQSANTPVPKVTQARDTAILDLARNDDLNVATIAREAQKRTEPPEDEVVISLH
jgi:hypothetical protein